MSSAREDIFSAVFRIAPDMSVSDAMELVQVIELHQRERPAPIVPRRPAPAPGHSTYSEGDLLAVVRVCYDPDVIANIKGGRRINAIKEVRAKTLLDLKPAKLIVEELTDRLPW